jgi:pimeloyl-ACP methyl ester carboxylesterase
MIAPLAKFIDWSGIQALWAIYAVQRKFKRIPHAPTQGQRLEDALQFVNGPTFIPRESQSAQLEFNGRLHFRFPTPRPSESAENNMVYGRLYRCSVDWQTRPAIILLHGGGGDPDYHFRFPLLARACNRARFNVTTLIGPCYFQRRPPAFDVLDPLDCFHFVQIFFAQAVAEIRALMGWLLEQGCPAVALWGSSYGGWLAGLTACNDARVSAVVMDVPGVCIGSVNKAQTKQILWSGIREELQARQTAYEALDETPLNPIKLQPAIPKERILLVEGLHDLFLGTEGREAVEQLWQAWSQPEIWRLPLGHLGYTLGLAPGLTGRILRWLTPRLEAGRKNNA